MLLERSVHPASVAWDASEHSPSGAGPAGPDPGDRTSEPALRLVSVETQVLPIGEVVAWFGLVLWGGALLVLIGSDLLTWYQHHHDRGGVGAGSRGRRDGRTGHARRHLRRR